MSMKHRLYRIGLPAYRFAMRQSRGLTLGVRVAVFDEAGRILLIEHTYTPGWCLPGGGVERGESTEQAAIRELEEEAGVRPLERPRLVSVHDNGQSFPGDHVLIFRVDRWEMTTPTSKGEILRHDWFDPRALPESTMNGTRRRVAEMLDGAPPDLFW